MSMYQLPSGMPGGMNATAPARVDAASDGVDLADVVRTLKGQWRAVVAFVALGVVGALAIILFAPRRFEGKATLLAHGGSTEAGGNILSRLTGLGGLMSGGALSGLPSPFESEIQVLRSRAVAGRVVDSLQLQFSVRNPAGLPPRAFIAASSLGGRFKPRRYSFRRESNGHYAVEAGGETFHLSQGQPGRIDVGEVTLQPGKLPGSFTLKVYDREDAITRLGDRLEANKAGGEVAAIRYRGEDSLTASEVPNLIVAYYLQRRTTVDRGTNARRLEYVTQQYDSIARELAIKEHALRAYQDSTGVLDPGTEGKAWLEGAVAMRESLTVVIVDESSINHLLDQVAKGTLSARQLAAYPAFLHGTAVMELTSQLAEMDAARVKLLEKRTERDPEVVVLSQNIAAVEAQILGMAKTYAASLRQHHVALSAQLDTLRSKVLGLPAAAEVGGRLQRDIARLTAIYTALQAQLVEAKLAAIGEGGDVRQIDVAQPPRKVAFPQPWATMGIGTVGGLVAGMVAALFLGWFGRSFRDPVDIERATGVAVQQLDANSPLLISATSPRTILVVPLAEGAQTGAVAQRLAHTATARALRANVLDLSSNVNGNGNGQDPASHSGTLIDKLELEGDVVVVQLPLLTSDATVAALRETRPVLLVAPPGPVDRAQLGSALNLLRRMGAPCAGVVVSDAPRRGLRA